MGQRRWRSVNIKTALDECPVFKLQYDTEHIFLYRRVWNLQSGNGFYLMVVCHQRKLKEQSLRKEFLKDWVAGAEWLVQGGGGGRISQITNYLPEINLLTWQISIYISSEKAVRKHSRASPTMVEITTMCDSCR